MKRDMKEEYLRPSVKESASYDERLADLIRRRFAFLKVETKADNEFMEALRALKAERRK